MAINIQGEYFNPVKELGKMLISAEQQEQIITSWSKALVAFKNGYGQLLSPAFHHAYLPLGWTKNDGAFDRPDEKIQKKIAAAAVAVAVILLFVIFG